MQIKLFPLLLLVFYQYCIPVPTGNSVSQCKSKCQETANLCYLILSHQERTTQSLGFLYCSSRNTNCKTLCNDIDYELVWIISPSSSGGGSGSPSTSSGNGGSSSSGGSGSSGSSNEITPEF